MSLVEDDPLVATVLEIRPRLHRLLHENLIAFWLPRCLDEEYGGFLIHHGPDGRWKGPADKYLVAQLSVAAAAASLSPSIVLPASMAMLEHSVRYGVDRRRGGLYESGPRGARADRRSKVWWVQAEGLMSGLGVAPRGASLGRALIECLELLTPSLPSPSRASESR